MRLSENDLRFLASLVDSAQELRSTYSRDVQRMEVTIRTPVPGSEPPREEKTRMIAVYNDVISDFEIILQDQQN